MSRKITVTGATGNTGQLVVPALLKGGAEVTALVRDSQKAEGLISQGVTVIDGEYTDTEAVQKAFEGADAILMIAPPNPDAARQMSGLIATAKKAGNPHVVRMSAIKAAADAPTDNGKLHHESDTELMESGLPYTILRPHFFMQNLWMSIPTIQEQSQIYWGMGDGKLGLIDVRDIADMAVKILLNGSHQGEILNPTGPDSITFTQVAEAISKSLDKEVTYVPVSYEQVRKSIIEMGWGDWGGQIMYDYSKAYTEGWGDFTTDDVKKVTGNKARSIDQFVNEVLAYGFQQQAP
ncbi:MAG: SDR family oxidoreductase [Candidatus Marinimicrobia bacterium]|nr:SDR family oxidoreductase [Candidatus Neomarinimicrobiota bacterium]